MVGWPVPLPAGGGDVDDRPDPTNHKSRPDRRVFRSETVS